MKRHIFDLLDTMCGVIHMPYQQRLEHAARRVELCNLPYLKMVPWELVHTLEELYAFEDRCLDAGFEGVILRDPEGMHKHGRATVTKGAYMRIKRFIDVEGTVEGVVEATENTNEAKINELGRSERSTHQANMVPKGMVGMLKMCLLADVEYRGQKLFEKGMLVDVGPGVMTHEDRIRFFKDPGYIIGTIGKIKIFPHGTKDKPRFPTWNGPRAAADMSE